MRNRIIWSIVALALLIAAGVVAWPLLRDGAAEPTSTIAVSEVDAVSDGGETPPPTEARSPRDDGSAADTAAVGAIQPLSVAELAFRRDGQVVEVYVASGTEVAAGDPLLRIDDSEAQLQVRVQEALVAIEAADLTLAEAEYRTAQARVAEAEALVARAEAELALLTAPLSPEELALQDAILAAASAGIVQASGRQAAALEGPTAADRKTAEATLAAAQANLVALQLALGPVVQDESRSPEERDGAQLRINAAAAAVAAAQTAVDQLGSGANAGERTAAAGAVAAASALEARAEAERALALSGPVAETVDIAAARLAQAERELERAQLEVAVAQAVIDEATAKLAEAEASLLQAQSIVDLSVLVAPFAGTMAEINIRAGEHARAGQPVVTLADLSGWVVETTDLTELDVVDIEPGDDTNVIVDAFQEQPLRGRVLSIAEQSQDFRGNVVYAMTIRLDPTELPLRWGMVALVTVTGGG